MNESTEPHIEKHYICPDEQFDLQRSEYVTEILEEFKKRWPSSFQYVHEMKTSICVSFIT